MDNFDSAITRVTEVLMFENWLRFYFIEEDDGGELFIRLPEKALQQIQNNYGQFYDLADRLNNREINHQTSMNEVCLFVAADFSSKGLPEDLATRVFDSLAFQLEVQMFGAWVQAHEDLLDVNFMDFATWRHSYEQWCKSDAGLAYRKKLSANMPTMAGFCTDTPQ